MPESTIIADELRQLATELRGHADLLDQQADAVHDADYSIDEMDEVEEGSASISRRLGELEGWLHDRPGFPLCEYVLPRR